MDNKEGSFKLIANPAWMLGSNIDAYNTGVIRGFSLSCAYNNTNYLYSFVIRTDINEN